MEKVTNSVKDTTETLVEGSKSLFNTSKTVVSQTMNLSTKDIGKKIFDNIIWVIIFIFLIIFIYLAYVITQSFNIDIKLIR